MTANLEETKRDKKILIVSGERRGESAGRSKYNEMEIHRTNAEAKAHRIVHQWRCCIDYSEKDVWELLKRHHINPHPCYRIGWNRCSCMMCIFSTPRLFAGVKELFPDDYAALRHDEEVLGFTLDNKKNLDEFIGDTQSCVCWKDKAAIHSILDLYGEPVTWVCPELERRISEALAVDERITGVTDFEFDLTVKGVVHAYFTVKTIYGDIKAEKGVKI